MRCLEIIFAPFLQYRVVPFWFKSFVFCELTIQFPFFFVALYGLYYGNQLPFLLPPHLVESPWIVRPMIAYAAHVLTTLVPMVVGFFDRDLVPTSTQVLSST